MGDLAEAGRGRVTIEVERLADGRVHYAVHYAPVLTRRHKLAGPGALD